MPDTDSKYPQINMIRTGEKLREISKQTKTSVKKIQRVLGLASNQAIYDWFNGKTLPTLNNFYILSHLFRVPMEEMIVPKGCESFMICFPDSDAKSISEYAPETAVTSVHSDGMSDLVIECHIDEGSRSKERLLAYFSRLSKAA